jgi:hypothetical protein
MPTPKPNQGMQRPSLGGIGSRIADARVAVNVCRHNQPWRVPPDGKVICGVCHPPAAGINVEWLETGGDT